MRCIRRFAGSQAQQCFSGFAWKLTCNIKQRVFIHFTNRSDPFFRKAVFRQLARIDRFEKKRFRRYLGWLFNVLGDWDFNDSFADLNQLSRTGRWMPFDFSSFCPVIRCVVMIEIAKQQRGIGLKNYDPNIATISN